MTLTEPQTKSLKAKLRGGRATASSIRSNMPTGCGRHRMIQDDKGI